MVTAKTSIYGLIGDPLEHSISPQIQNAAYNSMDLDALYICLHIRGNVPESVRAAASLGIKGLNVTIPYKSQVIPALDEIDEIAGKIGAVNVIRLGEEIRGFNTDVTASIRSLTEVSGPLQGKRVILVGAGGSARAVTYGLVEQDATVVISNRTPSRAEGLVDEVLAKTPGARISTLPLDDMPESLSESDVLINATPVGMYPKPGRSIVDSGFLNPDMTVMDLVYNPRKTKLLAEARAAGCRTVGGLKMLVYQAAESISIWTGLDPPVYIMIEAAKDALSKFVAEPTISTN
jgi:shikimate dehydrogenase